MWLVNYVCGNFGSLSVFLSSKLRLQDLMFPAMDTLVACVISVMVPALNFYHIMGGPLSDCLSCILCKSITVIALGNYVDM